MEYEPQHVIRKLPKIKFDDYILYDIKKFAKGVSDMYFIHPRRVLCKVTNLYSSERRRNIGNIIKPKWEKVTVLSQIEFITTDDVIEATPYYYNENLFSTVPKLKEWIKQYKLFDMQFKILEKYEDTDTKNTGG